MEGRPRVGSSALCVTETLRTLTVMHRNNAWLMHNILGFYG